ncbi:IncF plasmid conjugative transfer protein TraG [Vibrio jasicida]|uniref:conjugal transfer protein TraG N-terminal domain-containing protein n=1 Tax=Vibrio jasicida TaxID=766224 RepID=UPI002895870F|nr:IncF plasmid conjugative transfer protein TraG [Vibrio jasicida]
MTFEYYVYTQGDSLQRALNAVAAFFQTASFATMTSIALMIGAILTMIYFYATREPKHLYIWMIVFTLVPSMLLQQTARVQIIDKTEPSGVYSVDNVPYLVAIPTWFFSTMMMGVTETVESIFTTVDDERYGRTGMLFGSELYQLSRQSDLKDTALRKQWNDFFKNCIIGDIEINKKYTWDGLMQSSDVFAFLDRYPMSPLRGIMEDGTYQDFYTCKQIYPTVKAGFTSMSAQELDLIATYLHGAKASTYKAHVRNAMQNSYQKFIGVSNNAVDILKQNMAMNAIRYSINTLDPNANSMNYAYTSNKMQQTSMWATLGMQAREFIPMLHTMLFFLFSSLSFIVAVAAMIPSLTKMVLTNYVKTFAYLATWPPLFAILNAIMLWSLEGTSSANANPLNGLTLSNANALDELHMRFGYMAGFLMMTIPVLAGKVLQGGIAVAQAMNYQLASMINSTNARVSQASSTGSMDFGNLQMQNHSFNNTNSNKFDDNLSLRTGMATMQQSDGSTITTLQNDGGRRLYNAQEAESKPLWQGQVSSMLQNSVSDQYSSALTSQRQSMNNFTDSYSNSMQISDRWNDAWSSNRSYGDSYNTSTEGQITQSQSKMESAIDNISQTMGWTHDQSRAYANSVSAGIEAKSPGSFLGFGAHAGVKWSDDQRDAFSNMSAEQKQALNQATQQYNEGATSMQRAGRSIDAKENRSEVEQYAHDFALNHQRMQNAAVSVNESNAEVDSLQHMQTRLSTDSTTFGASAITGFQQHLERTHGENSPEVTRLMNASKPEDLSDVREHFARYTQTEGFQQAFGVSTSNSDLDDMANMYQPRNLNVSPSLNEGQQNVVETGAARSQNKVEEVTTDMINIKENDSLFDNRDFNNVKGNVSVTGGHMQGESSNHSMEQQIEPTVKAQVESELTPPSTNTTQRESPQHGNYPHYTPDRKNDA